MSQAEFTEDWFRRRPAVPQAGPAPGRCCLTPELPALFAFLRVYPGPRNTQTCNRGHPGSKTL